MTQVGMVLGSPEALPRRSLLSEIIFTPTPPRPEPAPRKNQVAVEFSEIQDVEPQQLLLPVLSVMSPPLVSCETVAALLSGDFTGKVSDYLIVDCRYDYEHEGGHLPRAISVNRHESLCKLHESLRQSKLDLSKMIIVFHCEFSQNRAPKAFHAFRSLDRAVNTYPMLTFPQMYIMEGGYRQFYELYKQLCMPSNYVPMTDPELSKRWKKEVVACRRSWNTRRKEKFEDDCESEKSPIRSSTPPLRRFIF